MGPQLEAVIGIAGDWRALLCYKQLESFMGLNYSIILVFLSYSLGGENAIYCQNVI